MSLPIAIVPCGLCLTWYRTRVYLVAPLCGLLLASHYHLWEFGHSWWILLASIHHALCFEAKILPEFCYFVVARMLLAFPRRVGVVDHHRRWPMLRCWRSLTLCHHPITTACEPCRLHLCRLMDRQRSIDISVWMSKTVCVSRQG